MKIHPGVETDMPRTGAQCPQALVVASDALTALIESRAAHAELIRCVQQFEAEAKERSGK